MANNSIVFKQNSFFYYFPLAIVKIEFFNYWVCVTSNERLWVRSVCFTQ